MKTRTLLRLRRRVVWKTRARAASQIHHSQARLVLATLFVVVGLAGPPAWAQQPEEISAPGTETLGNRGGLPVDPLVLTPVAWSVIATPVFPVKGTDGRTHLAYELLFTNVSSRPASLTAIEVVDPTRNNQVVGANKVLTITNQEVTTKFRHVALKQTTLDLADFSDRLEPGQSAYLYLDVTFNSLREVPRQIKHRVTVSQMDAQNRAVLITGVGGLTTVSRREAIVLSPPLRGDRWVDGSGCCEIISPHRYTILPSNGTLRPAEKYAIDFVQLDAQGRAVVGDVKELKNWHFYGAEIVAAARGRVVEVVDNLRDEVPGQLPPDATAATAAGNHVIIDMGGGRYALYAHLIPGSVAVSVGESVARGQRLGLLGNSGNSDAPHLHFQVMDRPSALDANGLPFVFDRMEYQGRAVGTVDNLNTVLSTGGALEVNAAGRGPRRREMPLTKDVVGFK
jgi:hypothetical protein